MICQRPSTWWLGGTGHPLSRSDSHRGAARSLIPVRPSSARTTKPSAGIGPLGRGHCRALALEGDQALGEAGKEADTE